MTAPSFLFRNADTSRGITSSGEGAYEFYHPLLPTTLLNAAGFLLILNGWNMNRLQADLTGYDGTADTAVQLLQMRAPRQAITPVVSWVGAGRIARSGAKWRYRYKDSRTGICSGLSPIPNLTFDLGVWTPVGGSTFLGQQVWFMLATSDKPASADTIELFANTTQEDNAWYLADSKATGVASYVLLTDNNTDDELFTREAVMTGVPSSIPDSPTWSVGLMPPLVRAWLHPAGRVFYFGLRRFGRYGPTSVPITVTEGGDLVSLNSIADRTRLVEPGRIGQRVRFYTSITPITNIVDPTVYRIIKMESATTFRVYPELQVSSSLVAGATATTWYFSIEDDRDSRWTWMSEVNKPWLIDPLKTLAAGDDYDDGVMVWFSYKGDVFMQSKRRIYQADNAAMEDPSRATTFTPIVEEGTPGFYSGCITPIGYVYWHETRGVRLFLGGYSMALTGSFQHGLYGTMVPEELPFSEFPPREQFLNVDPGYTEDVKCVFDGEHKTVIISYVPLGSSGFRESMIFSLADHCWRGPYREGFTAHGHIRSLGTVNLLTFGDAYGSLFTREAQVLDMVPTIVTTFAGAGTITATSTNRTFSDVSAHFNVDADKRLRGSPIWFYDGTYYYFARIADVLSDILLELDAPPVREDGVQTIPVVAWTYGVGSIRWSVVTAYLDYPGDQDGPGDPGKIVYWNTLSTRFLRGTSSESFEVGAAKDGSGVYVGTATSTSGATYTTPTRNVNGKTWGLFRLQGEGASCQIRLRGTARAGHPQITKMNLRGTEKEGDLAP